MDGPKEQAVRATLSSRQAGELRKLPHRRSIDGTAWSTFSAIFSGVWRPRIYANGVFRCGKAEAEWGWPTTWEQLRDAGLITLEILPPDTIGRRKVKFEVTELGRKVRSDDLAYFAELLDARKADDVDAANALPEAEKKNLIERFQSGEPMHKILDDTDIPYGVAKVLQERAGAPDTPAVIVRPVDD